jgi:hypothetical protein
MDLALIALVSGVFTGWSTLSLKPSGWVLSRSLQEVCPGQTEVTTLETAAAVETDEVPTSSGPVRH